MDVLGSDAPERVPLDPWVRRLGAVALAVLAAGVLAAVRVEEPAAPAPSPAEAGVVFAGGEVVQDAGGATGDLALEVVNRGERPLVVSGLTLRADGLQVTSVAPGLAVPLQPFGQRRYVLRYVVLDCRSLRLPGELRLSVGRPGEPLRQQSVPLATPATGTGVPFAPCPPAPLALAVRPLGGVTESAGPGARGSVRLEVRNGGPSLALLSLTAEVPGARFSALVPPNGVVLRTEERIELVLGFDVDDCALLRRTGRLVLVARLDGVVRELGLTITTDREAGTVRQVVLDRVLSACPR